MFDPKQGDLSTLLLLLQMLLPLLLLLPPSHVAIPRTSESYGGLMSAPVITGVEHSKKVLRLNHDL
jgi:hypothetical protein